MKKTILILFSVLFLNQHVLAVTLFEALTEAYKNNTDLNAERENINISEEDLKIMSSGDIIKFMQTYQRITQQMFKDALKSSSIIMNLNSNHQIEKIKFKK